MYTKERLTPTRVYHLSLGAANTDSFLCILPEIIYVFINGSNANTLYCAPSYLYILNIASSFFLMVIHFSTVESYILNISPFD